MVHFEITIHAPEEEQELLIAMFLELDFVGFTQDTGELKAVTTSEAWRREELEKVLAAHDIFSKTSYEIRVIENQNWNESWEADFHPVVIEDKLTIRASFHPPASTDLEVLIDPQMAFGTGHHATTLQILKWLLGENVMGKSLLDWGAGSGILAILASKLGCSDIVALENDEVALDALVDNVKKNGINNIQAHPDESFISKDQEFEIVLMNINKNTILEKFNVIPEVLAATGTLVLSGFYTSDIKDITDRALQVGFQLSNSTAEDDWACLTFQNLK